MIKTYGQVINETLSEAMEKDSSIFLFGEDIGEYGGCFGITKDLLKRYGPNRVIDSPMSEQAIIGLGIGAAISGLKPIVEIMFMDFMTLTYDQLFNHASIFNYLSNSEVPVPLVVRVSAGAGRGYGATHSKTLIAPLMHIPGIKIVAPSSVGDVRGLLNESIKDKNPVIFIENKLLYSLKEELEEIPESIPLGKANTVRNGKDILLITFSKSVHDCIKASEELKSEGINCEVLDLRTLNPLDMDAIKSSVDRIKKVIVVEEGYSACGVAAEIITRINEHCFYSLDAAPRRITSLDVPISCCKEFESFITPSIQRIKEEVRKVVNG